MSAAIFPFFLLVPPPCGPQALEQIALPFAHLVLLADVQPQRHEFQIGDDVIQAGSDGEGDDVING